MMDDNQDTTGITWRDMLAIAVIMLLVMVIWMMPHLNPKARDDGAEPPGNLIVHVSWPRGDTDVDVWLTGPGERRPVGYSNLSGTLWNLLRDDRGDEEDNTRLNYENAYTRGIVAGEYVVNVHCYDCKKLPVPVVVEVSIKVPGANGKGGIRRLITTTVTLHTAKQEVTAVRFRLTKDGRVVKGSVNRVYKPLHNAG